MNINKRAFIITAIILFLLTLFLVSCIEGCNTQKHIQKEPQKQEERTYITIDGQKIELVADENDNQYLKEYPGNASNPIYIPFPYATSDNNDSLKTYYAKNNKRSHKSF